jgi:SGNH hydrolase-like domain, acetyltransferase AlgX
MKLPSVLRNVLLVTASAGLTMVLVELGLRLTGYAPAFLFQMDPVVSATFIPGKEAWYRFAEGRQWVQINSYGYRDKEWSLDKPPGVYRIALLGDSFIAALEVEQDHRLSDLLEAKLNTDGHDSMHYEVLNFGVQGYGTAQELETLRDRALKFKLDAVLLFVCTGNDWYDNSVELDPEPNRLHYTLDSSGGLVRLPFSIRDNAIKKWLRAHSAAYLFTRDRIKRLRSMHGALTAFGLMQDANPSLAEAGQALQGRQYLLDLPPAIERSWVLTEALIGEVSRLASANGLQFGVVVVPTKWEIAGVSPTGGVETESMDFEKSLRRIHAMCGRLQIDCLDLTEALEGACMGLDDCYFPIDAHWNKKGHRIAAQAVFHWLQEGLSGGHDGA